VGTEKEPTAASFDWPGLGLLLVGLVLGATWGYRAGANAGLERCLEQHGQLWTAQEWEDKADAIAIRWARIRHREYLYRDTAAFWAARNPR